MTLEQIEALMLNATLYRPMHISHMSIEHEVVKELCVLAKRGLETRRPTHRHMTHEEVEIPAWEFLNDSTQNNINKGWTVVDDLQAPDMCAGTARQSLCTKGTNTMTEEELRKIVQEEIRKAMAPVRAPWPPPSLLCWSSCDTPTTCCIKGCRDNAESPSGQIYRGKK
jgi:hypothetical protein